MNILVIGGSGTIGRIVVEFFQQKHEVFIAGRNHGDVRVDISEESSIEKMFQELNDLDAVLCIAGEAKWAYLSEMTEEDFYIGIRSKLMGQINLTRIAQRYLNKGASITLTTGILAEDPVVMTTSAAMVNGAIHSFVKAAALEMQNDIRINAVAAGLVQDAAVKYADYFPGYNPVPMKKVVNGYVRSVLGKKNGEVIRVYE